MKAGKYYSFEVCDSCGVPLTFKDLTGTNGTCRECGHSGNYSTITPHEKITIRQFRHHPWWRFWNTEYTYQGANPRSIDWLKDHGYKIEENYGRN